ncbi:hypothetical protein BC628DRAFT_1405900 [Trametes gibbosa]|nr:hypothetical protein BC628DRAFT_1405900 [Trametes gibbosa]
MTDRDRTSLLRRLGTSTCTKAIDDYRSGIISKAKAVLTVSAQLVSAENHEPGVTSDDSTIQPYLAMLDEVDRLRQPTTGSAEAGGEELGGTGGMGRAPRDASTPEPSPSSARSQSTESGSDVEESPRKRSRPNPVLYAWAASDFLLGTKLHPDVLRTLELIRLYGECYASVLY